MSLLLFLPYMALTIMCDGPDSNERKISWLMEGVSRRTIFPQLLTLINPHTTSMLYQGFNPRSLRYFGGSLQTKPHLTCILRTNPITHNLECLIYLVIVATLCKSNELLRSIAHLFLAGHGIRKWEPHPGSWLDSYPPGLASLLRQKSFTQCNALFELLLTILQAVLCPRNYD